MTKHAPATGARPAGVEDEQAAAGAVMRMFDEIAPRYDLLNHVLSVNVDRLWWWRAARAFRHILTRQDSCVLDLCCGTGDMALALRRRAGRNEPQVIAADFAHGMLSRGAGKFRGRNILPIEADALRLPIASARFDLVVSAFGFRNLANYRAGLREIFRVLRPGGELGILDFSEPGGWFGSMYGFYFRRILPQLGSLLSGVRGPYSYLPASVDRFPAPPQMLEHMRAEGYVDVSWTPYSFGIAGLYRGKKPNNPMSF